MEEGHQADTLDMQRELGRINEAVEHFGVQLDALNNELITIQEENQTDDVTQQIAHFEEQMRHKKDIAAEDALDSIVRLQNQLKIVKRRNQLLARENTVQQKQLNDRAAFLKSTTQELDRISYVTGWHENFVDVDLSEQTTFRDSIRDMVTLIAKTTQELKVAKVLIKKKENVILTIQKESEMTNEHEKKLQKVYNDIRVRQRDTRELEAKLQRLHTENNAIETALSKVDDTQIQVANSIQYMESDKEYLADAVTEMKVVCRRQDNVVKAQLARQQQLQKRLDHVLKALREMRLEKEFERNVAKSALVPSASREEPEDVDMILPEDEIIPVDTHRLLYKDNEMMRTNVARKNMLVLEKESAIQALESKVALYIDAHNTTAMRGDDIRATKESELGVLTSNLEAQHEQYKAELDVLLHTNQKLKKAYCDRYQAIKHRRPLKK
ncbi:hypothetical protein STCU_04270 [Strigomonas culicis]|uniref:Uncharacterized protein n=1 Tax=Strigomonas culicis TaxID=28005 RepID=S9UGU8_9TRYP|nr:hypothetical protein STCU_04270 [Strigomonas culicis]|eukprot:EPY30032.1 hypothetical protein STCU_04270 [Strigomonas culicis]